MFDLRTEYQLTSIQRPTLKCTFLIHAVGIRLFPWFCLSFLSGIICQPNRKPGTILIEEETLLIPTANAEYQRSRSFLFYLNLEWCWWAQRIHGTLSPKKVLNNRVHQFAYVRCAQDNCAPISLYNLTLADDILSVARAFQESVCRKAIKSWTV